MVTLFHKVEMSRAKWLFHSLLAMSTESQGLLFGHFKKIPTDAMERVSFRKQSGFDGIDSLALKAGKGENDDEHDQ